jgi:hypothetical protein
MKIAKAQLEALEFVVAALEKRQQVPDKVLHLKALLSRLRKTSAPKPVAGIGVARAVAAMREVLGTKLGVPTNPSTNWLSWMASRIRDLGLTEEDCRKIARVLLTKWNPPYGFEYAIKSADRLLVEDVGAVKGRSRERAPVEMGE